MYVCMYVCMYIHIYTYILFVFSINCHILAKRRGLFLCRNDFLPKYSNIFLALKVLKIKIT